jgi:hypothetical protein
MTLRLLTDPEIFKIEALSKRDLRFKSDGSGSTLHGSAVAYNPEYAPASQ